MREFVISTDDSQERWNALYAAIELAAERLAEIESTEAVAESPGLIYIPGRAA